MARLPKNHSISRDYLAIFAAIFLMILLSSFTYIWSVTHSREELRNQELLRQSNRISQEISVSFDYVAYLLRFLGEEISKNNPDDLTKIFELLRSQLITEEPTKNRFSRALFYWYDKNNLFLVNSRIGVSKKNTDMSYRHYVKMASIHPWKLHFDSPDIGITSGEWTIPAGMGVLDKKGHFLGTIGFGFSIARFSQQIEEAMDDKDVSFVILDNDYKMAMHSIDIPMENSDMLLLQEKMRSFSLASSTGPLPKSVRIGNILYSYYYKLDGYPYTILVGYNTAIAVKDFREILLPGIIALLIISLTMLGLLLLLRHLVVKPVILLSEAADRIAHGEDIQEIKGINSQETINLAKKLLTIKALLVKEKLFSALEVERQTLANKIAIAKESDSEKECFLRDMHQALHEPLRVIKECAGKIRNNQLLSPEKIQTCCEMIENAASQLLTYTSDTLYFSEVDVKEVVEKCAIIQKKAADNNNISLTLDIASSILPLPADRLRLQQIILSTLHESMSYTQPGGRIHISACVEQDNVMIIIEDNGMGFNEEERNEFIEITRNQNAHIQRDPDATNLGLYGIKHLIALHGGIFEVHAKRMKGTCFKIYLPYGDRLKDSNHNVVHFPRKY